MSVLKFIFRGIIFGLLYNYYIIYFYILVNKLYNRIAAADKHNILTYDNYNNFQNNLT